MENALNYDTIVNEHDIPNAKVTTNETSCPVRTRRRTRSSFLQSFKVRFASSLAVLTIAATGVSVAIPESSTAATTIATAAQRTFDDHQSMPAMTVGKAVDMTPPQLARQRTTAMHAVVGGTTEVQANANSGNWSGLATSSAYSHAYQGIAGEWTVPTVQATTSNKYSCTWVGIDGWSSKPLIQTGTEEDSVGGHTRYYAWLEMLPANQSIITYANGTAVPVLPGDVMWSYIYETGTNMWAIYLQDITRGWTLSTTVSYSAPGMSVEWVHEATTVNGVISPPPAFSKVNFSSLEVLEAGTWYYTTMKASSEVYMVQKGVTYATPSAPTNTAPQRFSITYG